MDRPARLTAAFVEAVTEPKRYTDGPGSHGLTLMVRARRAGGVTKNWQQQIRVRGRLRSIGLGGYPEVKLAEARNKAADNAAKIKTAFPPRPKRTGIDRLLAEASGGSISASIYPTFSEIAQEAIELNRSKWKGAATFDQRQGLLRAYVNPVIGDTAIDQVTSDQIIGVLGPLWNTKVSTAKKVLQALQSTMNYAVGMHHVVNDPIPRAKVGLGRQTQSTEHHEYLPYERMGEFWKVLKANESNVTRILELIVLTAARSGEARGARWGEVDLGNATWTIPAVRMKKGREHRIPLSPAAIDVLRRARAAQPPTAGWSLIFPNGGGREMTKETPLRFIRKHFPKIVVHGFRTTLDMWASEQTEYAAQLVDHALAHLNDDATIRAYRRTDFFDKRRALMNDWAEYVTTAQAWSGGHGPGHILRGGTSDWSPPPQLWKRDSEALHLLVADEGQPNP